MTRYHASTFLFFLVTACAVDGASGEPGEGGSEPAAEGDMGQSASELTYPTQHPRIYLTPNRARLQAALSQGTPAATRFRTKVDQWLGGASIWGFQSWNGALLSQL